MIFDLRELRGGHRNRTAVVCLRYAEVLGFDVNGFEHKALDGVRAEQGSSWVMVRLRRTLKLLITVLTVYEACVCIVMGSWRQNLYDREGSRHTEVAPGGLRQRG